MSYLATLGTSSCATSAIGGFKTGQRKANEAYKATPADFNAPTDGLSVQGYYSKILHPTAQELGRTHDLPLEKLMQDIEASSMKTKLLMATLNTPQYQEDDNYWPKELKKWGFKLIAKTKNTIGTVNYMYMRNPNEVAIEEGEF